MKIPIKVEIYRKFGSTWQFKVYRFIWHMRLAVGLNPQNSRILGYIVHNVIDGKWGPPEDIRNEYNVKT